MLRNEKGIVTTMGIFDLVPLGSDCRVSVQSLNMRPPDFTKNIVSIFLLISNSRRALWLGFLE